MKPDQKYMNEVIINNKENNIRFVPPSFNRPYSEDDNKFPSETNESEMHCYYNSITPCPNTVEENRIPSPSDVLMNLNFDVDELTSNTRSKTFIQSNLILKSLEKNEPNIIATFSSYKIPYPITKILLQKIIKLSLDYYDNK
ncbi:hypothetical protein [Clostridium sp. BJN0001]|uniref:hypothetical protein n=1 Tax=Clostridium sp. BJN0001 TaxID=2930219 RepID=UPI001FCFFF3C|nr:hypothetical protein [Clostridium sp. BJN0001]